MTPDFPLRGKVRIGEKRTSQRGSQYPAAVDYFRSDDPEFAALVGDKPQMLRIRFVHATVEDNFSTGMEYWRKNQLACYTKDSGDKPVALRVPSLVESAGGEKVGEPTKSGRVPILCTFRQCPFMQSKDCKPMGRLVFYVEGDDPSKGLWELDTKSWNSIEALVGAMTLFGDPRGRVFELHVRMEQRRTEKFPLLSITEANVEVKTAADLAKASALLDLRGALDAGEPVRLKLSAALDQTNPGWRDNPAIIDRIKEVGADDAAKALLTRYEL